MGDPVISYTGAIRMSNSVWNTLLALLIAAVFGVVWLPEVGHYYVATPSIGHEALARFRDIVPLPGSLLDKPDAIGVVVPPLLSSRDPIALAEQILRGGYKPGYDLRPVRFPMVAEDLAARGPEAGLSLASLAVPSIFLNAYRASGNARYLEAAKQDILSWSRLERHAWLPVAYLWNDHAIAARTGVLLRFLATYRRLPDIDEHALRESLVFAIRGLRFLAKTSHFTFWSNHGVMQNLALLEGAAFFSFLPESATWADVAMERLESQFMWYVGDDGFVLEDSPGYHRVGVGLLESAIRMAKLANRDIPKSWVERYENARSIDSALARPDGTLPVFGDTDGGASPGLDRTVPGETAAASKCTVEKPLIYPISGLAIVWSRLRSTPDSCHTAQLVVKWSHWPGHAHQTPDEMALTLWAGTPWLTNLGYWPYGFPGRKFTDSWQSSNAPHLLGEFPVDASRLVSGAHGSNGDRFMLDLLRNVGSGQTVRRQVLGIEPGQWIVIDSLDGKGAVPFETVWTFPPDVTLVPLEVGQGFRAADHRGYALLMRIFGAPKLTVHEVHGQSDSAPGWTVVDRMPARTASIVVHQTESPGYLAMVLSVNPQAYSEEEVRMIEWLSPDRWKMEVSESLGTHLVQRDGSVLTLSEKDNSNSIKLSPLPDTSENRAADQRRLTEALTKYPKWRDVYTYRLKVSRYLWAVVISTLCGLLLVRRGQRLRNAQWPYFAMVSGWALLLVILPVYFRT